MGTILKEGMIAPDFTADTNDGGTLDLDALRGKIVVLYFYPKNDTPGCTKQAIEFNQNRANFSQKGACIIGVSPDTPAKHAKFKSKHNLKITLASDQNQTVCETYGVWVQKNMYGRQYMGVERSTFIIGENGVILAIWRKVKVKGHVEAVFERLKLLVDNRS